MTWDQLALTTLTCGGAWLVGSRARRTRRWGFVATLASEPLWLVVAWQAHRWDVALVALWFTVTSIRGIVTHCRPAAGEE